jgi:hypothetical protein
MKDSIHSTQTAIVRCAIGLVALTLGACSESSMSAPPEALAISSLPPVMNQAKVYAHTGSTLMFDKGGPGGHGSPGGPGGPGGPACTLPDSLVMDVGPKGASFSANGSSLVFPKNALSQMTHIVMVPELDSTVAVQFYPEGLVFNPSALPTLTINMDCIGDPANAYIVYTDSLGTVLENKKTTGKDAHSVATTLQHFSRYAVDW